MKKFTFLILISLLSLADALMAQGTSVSSEFHADFATFQNHAPAFNGGQSITFKPNLPCLIIGGYSVNAAGVKTVWGVHQASTYARWDTLATIEAKNGAYRFVEMSKCCGVHLPEDCLFLPQVGAYNLDWVRLAGYALPAGFQSFGITVAIFDYSNIK